MRFEKNICLRNLAVSKVCSGKIEIVANERAVNNNIGTAFSFATSSILSLTICKFDLIIIYSKKGSKGLKCPVCADRAVLEGYNDLATTDKALLKEWLYALNTDIEPTKITRNSLRPVWWQCKYGHAWKEKIAKRTIEGERCPVCEEEFARVLPQLLIMLYCGRLGFKVRLNDEETIGITLDAYIPELKLAVALIGNGTKAEEEAVLVTQHLCKVRGLLFDTVSFKDSAEGVCRGVKKAFQGAHIYITSDNDDDVRTAHRQFFRWKKC